MPTYEYECEKCGHRFELFQSMKDEPKKRCPKCRGKVRRLIGTGAGMIFKGSGFYVTDYRSDSYKSQKKSEAGEGSKPAAASDAPKSETPAAPKPERKPDGGGAKKKKKESA
ncbi:MAG TPA: FmdB family zinc ribbon protein [Candidatus Eisenbacteria bacterium]|nr:FmdB family zinc ribbon protein [Candidatus Eisenbacteria bacterium]